MIKRSIISFFLLFTFLALCACEKPYDKATVIYEDQAHVKCAVSEPIKPVYIPSTFTMQSIKTSVQDEFNFWLYTPETPVKDMPLVIYLHGSAEKGYDLSVTVMYGFGNYISTGKLGDVPAYVVMPQVLPTQKGWLDAKVSVKELVDYMAKNYHIDTGKVAITGHSMGGTGAWNIATEYPNVFTRVAPVSGWADITEKKKRNLKNKEIWAFVGSEDYIIRPNSSVEMVELLNCESARVTVFSGATHTDVPLLTYLDQEVMDWLCFKDKK